MALKVVMDVDTGIDDALALMYAVAHPDIELLAVTCVAGNADVANVVKNTLGVLELMEAPEIPVAAGAQQPLIEPARSAEWLHGKNGLANIELNVANRVPVAAHAVELLRELLQASVEPVTIIATAPLTNIALLLRMYPHLHSKIARIVFMGGSAGRGNATAVAEFNMWHDPEAGQIVVSSGIELLMYGLDVFEQVQVPDELIEYVKSRSDSRSKLLGQILGYSVAEPGTDRMYTNRLIGDAGAVCALMHPELFSFETWPVRVSLGAGITRGQTVVDRRHVGGEDAAYGESEESSPVEIALGVDVPGVLREFFTRVLPNFS